MSSINDPITEQSSVSREGCFPIVRNEPIVFAVMFDADNFSFKNAVHVIRRASDFGTCALRRVYGDWSQPSLSPWFDVAKQLGLDTRQQSSNPGTKNSTDIGITIDAMDLLYSNRYSGFVIAASDSDYTQLALRLREDNKVVLGFGDPHSPAALRNACSQFFVMKDIIPTNRMKNHPLVEKKLSIHHAVGIVLLAMGQVSKDNEWIELLELEKIIRQSHPSFSYHNYGVASFSDLAKNTSALEVWICTGVTKVRRQVSTQNNVIEEPSSEAVNVNQPEEIDECDESQSVNDESVTDVIFSAMEEVCENGEWINLDEVERAITQMHPSFSYDQYGSESLLELMRTLPQFELCGSTDIRCRISVQDDNHSEQSSIISSGPYGEDANIVIAAVERCGKIGEWVEVRTVEKSILRSHGELPIGEYGFLCLIEFMFRIPQLEIKSFFGVMSVRRVLSMGDKIFDKESPNKLSIQNNNLCARRELKIPQEAATFIRAAMNETGFNEEWYDLAHIGKILTSLYPKFSFHDYGCQSLAELIAQIPEIKVRTLKTAATRICGRVLVFKKKKAKGLLKIRVRSKNPYDRCNTLFYSTESPSSISSRLVAEATKCIWDAINELHLIESWISVSKLSLTISQNNSQFSLSHFGFQEFEQLLIMVDHVWSSSASEQNFYDSFYPTTTPTPTRTIPQSNDEKGRVDVGVASGVTTNSNRRTLQVKKPRKGGALIRIVQTSNNRSNKQKIESNKSTTSKNKNLVARATELVWKAMEQINRGESWVTMNKLANVILEGYPNFKLGNFGVKRFEQLVSLIDHEKV